MFPDVNGLRQSIDANTNVQREVLLTMQKLLAAVQEQNKYLAEQNRPKQNSGPR